jgi:hypothetical protein
LGALILALVAAATVVLVLGPLFSGRPAWPEEEPQAAGPSDESALREDVATGKLAPDDLEEGPR